MMFRSYEVECVYVSSICVRVGVECVVLCVSALVCGLDHSCVVLGYVSFICFVWGCCSYICIGGVSLVCVVFTVLLYDVYCVPVYSTPYFMIAEKRKKTTIPYSMLERVSSYVNY